MKIQLTHKLSFPTLDGFVFIHPGEIILCRSEGNYTSLDLNNQPTLVISRQLGQLEAKLPSRLFIRVHHSYLINTLFLKKYLHQNGGQILMANGSTIPVSRRRKKELINFFNQM